jgi:hypothetical protein
MARGYVEIFHSLSLSLSLLLYSFRPLLPPGLTRPSREM